jgi:DNA-binding NtrC family response regulator
MRSARTTASELLRLLAEISTPIYWLDEQRRIVFINRAACDWLGVSAEELIGRQCRYQSGDADPISALADSLCPPPEVFHGHRASGCVSKPTAEGHLERRHADFIPLPSEDDHWVGTLAILQATNSATDRDSSAAPLSGDTVDSAPSSESRILHELMQRFRRESTQWHHLDRLVGRSAAMARVREQIKLAAVNNCTVLIVGPPGIGRQHVARTIHAVVNYRGDIARTEGTLNQTGLSVISCSALPPDLLRSTIGSVIERNKMSNGLTPATLLLADVDRLAAEMQPEIVRWLDSNPQNLRTMSTAREPLEVLAERGSFHADLAQRLSTLVIELPPLVERREDIPLLAQSFMEDLNAQGEKQLRGFATDAMDRLCLYDWPGQIDELAAIVRQAFAQAETFEITSADLPKKLHLAAEAARHPRSTPETIDLEKFLTQVETELIQRALRQSKGNKSHAARLLGISRPRLYRRMVQLGLAAGEEQ